MREGLFHFRRVNPTVKAIVDSYVYHTNTGANTSTRAARQFLFLRDLTNTHHQQRKPRPRDNNDHRVFSTVPDEA